jgi:hypothetical protein
MFDFESLTNPWSYYEFKQGQELYTTGDWCGKRVHYMAGGPHDAWTKADCLAMNAYEWAGCREKYFSRGHWDKRLRVHCNDWSNASSRDPWDHVSRFRRELALARARRLAIGMFMHHRLSADSLVGSLDDGIVRMIFASVFKFDHGWVDIY